MMGSSILISARLARVLPTERRCASTSRIDAHVVGSAYARCMRVVRQLRASLSAGLAVWAGAGCSNAAQDQACARLDQTWSIDQVRALAAAPPQLRVLRRCSGQCG